MSPISLHIFLYIPFKGNPPYLDAATGRKRAPGGAAVMQQCQNHWQAWHILQCAQSRRSGRKQEKLREKSGKLRCRCGFARTQAFKHAWRGIFCRARSDFQHDWLDMFIKRDTTTEPHRHTETAKSTSLENVRPSRFCLRIMRLTAEN